MCLRDDKNGAFVELHYLALAGEPVKRHNVPRIMRKTFLIG